MVDPALDKKLSDEPFLHICTDSLSLLSKYQARRYNLHFLVALILVLRAFRKLRQCISSVEKLVWDSIWAARNKALE